MTDDRFGVAKPYMVMRRKGCGTASATEKEKTRKQKKDKMNRREKLPTGRREEEWKKKLQNILNEITCHTLVNNTERKKQK